MEYEKIKTLAEYLGIDEKEIAVSDYDENLFETPLGAYTVYTETEAKNTFIDYQEQLLDDIGLDAFTPNAKEYVMKNCIYSSELIDTIEEYYEEYYNDIERERPWTKGFEDRLQEELYEQTDFGSERVKEYFALLEEFDEDEYEAAKDELIYWEDELERIQSEQGDDTEALEEFTYYNNKVVALETLYNTIHDDYSDIHEWFETYEENKEDLIEIIVDGIVEEYEDNPVEWLIDNYGMDEVTTALKNGYYGLKFNILAICNYIEELDGRGPSLSGWNGEEIEYNDFYIYQQDDF